MSFFNDLMSSKMDLIGQRNFGMDLRDMENLSRDEKIKQIAVQFEEMLLNTMLKDAFKFEKKESTMGSMKTLADMRIMYLSQYIANNGGLGYQKILEDNIKRYYQQGSAANPNQQGSGFTLQSPEKSPLPELSLPVDAGVSSEFGWRIDPINGAKRFHEGIDLSVPMNSPVKSLMDGKVVFSGWKKGYGRVIEIEHSNNLKTVYAHNSELKIEEGEPVKTGDTVAFSGSSGRSTGPHLHFEIRKGNIPVDPLRFFKENNLNVF